jgi:hypothetical protein
LALTDQATKVTEGELPAVLCGTDAAIVAVAVSQLQGVIEGDYFSFGSGDAIVQCSGWRSLD